MLDAFQFAEEADALRDIRPESRQATILENMLRCVTECAEFITLYAEDVQVGASSRSLSLVITNMWFTGKRILKNIFGPVDGKIAQYRTNLIRLRDRFLTHAAITTEVTVMEAGT
jgi:hypothetical protein